MDAFNVELPAKVRDLHKDLATKFRQDGPRAEQLWRSFDKNKRAHAMVNIATGKLLLKPTDTRLGNLHLLIPEFNLLEISAPDDDRLLDLIRHRATTSLWEQYNGGVGEELGDATFIEKSLRNGLTGNTSDSLQYSLTIFTDNEKYAERTQYQNKKKFNQALSSFSSPATSGACVPRAIGDLILTRQHSYCYL
ncbi:hypothetical protein VTL71DRAFT_4282 [Oculimacula yallundae]|uniref:Uncharacterized protein n=1 Tax=Oculimacula yallundae TaxID=86028 RepID=A0ABR4C5D7_9HELO